MAKDDNMLLVIDDPDNARQLEEKAARSETDLHIIVFDNLAAMPAVIEQIPQNLREGYFVFLQETFENVGSETGEPVNFKQFFELLPKDLNDRENNHLVVWSRRHRPTPDYDGRKVVLDPDDSDQVFRTLWYEAVRG